MHDLRLTKMLLLSKKENYLLVNGWFVGLWCFTSRKPPPCRMSLTTFITPRQYDICSLFVYICQSIYRLYMPKYLGIVQ